MEINELTGEVIGAAIEVHRHLGPGLLENTYERCLCFELVEREIPFERQKEIPVNYKGNVFDCGYRIDLLIDKRLILELKSIESIIPIHEAQVLTYLKLAKVKHGLLINFNVMKLKDGIKRLVNGL